jgi:hypothetical protein
MTRLIRRMTRSAIGVIVILAATLVQMSGATEAGAQPIVRAALAPGSNNNILVIDIENESFSSTFGAGSPATYLNGTIVPQGELLQNYYAIGHVSLDNYIAQVSGQAPTPQTAADCFGSYTNVSPGTDDPNSSAEPGQVDGTGCVYPAPTSTTHGAPTIADQLDATDPPNPTTHVASWREYAEDMGNDATRDNGTTDPMGGTDCAHPAISGTDNTEFAEAADQYTDRHNPFIYFHSVIDNTAECNANDVPLGTVAVGTPSTFNGVSLPDTFTGHLANDLSSITTTPKFGFITPNLCDDGHDGTCAGTNIEGQKTGGLAGADLWLKHYMPLIMASPAYASGQMLVVVTADEGALNDSTGCCNEQPGPNDSSITGGGRVGALMLNKQYIVPGTVDTTGYYNHYSALRSYEDLLGLTSGGADGLGHLGFAAVAGLTPFGQDIFQPNQAPTIVTNPQSQSAVAEQGLTFTAAADITTPTVQWQVSIDGGNSWFAAGGPTTASVTTGPLTNFEQGWEVRAVFTNHLGSATTNPATITVLPPATDVVLPSNNATLAGSQYLDAFASPGTSQVQYELSGGPDNYMGKVISSSGATYYGWIGGWDTTTVPNGTYTLQSVASSGGLRGASPGISVTVDNPPPTTYVALPANGATLKGGQYLDAVASSGVTQVQYEISGGPDDYVDQVISGSTPTYYGWVGGWNTAGVPDGTYTLDSVASYAGGVAGTSSPITITVAN